MKTSLILACAALALHALPAAAAAPEALLKQHNCLACHALDAKLVGPSYQQVAAKYKGQDAALKLMDKVKKGGSGSFGPVPMSPNPQVPDAELKAMVQWILNR
ncbi:c-type cytochrome [Chromobacterium rhizoryzae]|uniref:c-type cytochrome n=1 Tax=Chromobacterium rhizoryzae TaxID=1778675 RepID=UPI001D08A562|nr:c-type cytochrome [Chromobacterium rhizoryzae]